MATKFTMKQHDLEPSFEVQLLDGVTPVDLTSVMEVLFLMHNRKGLRASGPMVVADQTQLDNVGICRYTWQLGDTAVTGSYNAEVQVTWPASLNAPDGRPQTFPANQYVTVEIQKDLGPGRLVLAGIDLEGGGDVLFEGINDTVDPG